MFRRSGKNAQNEKSAPYGGDSSGASPFNRSKRGELEDPPSRLFESPLPLPTPMENGEENWGNSRAAPLPHHFEGTLQNEVPETTLGAGVTFRGQLSFEHFLRIDGSFEGELLSQGKVIVGATGRVKADLNLREAIIEGVVEGNITIQERLELRGEAVVKGDIQAKSLCVDEGVTITGYVLVTPSTSTPP
jgi:cytoskeletal protein CcmA (bactofilin family)